MITEELIDELEQRFNGWNRTGDHGILRFLNSAHEILMTVEAEQTLMLDTSTGELPLLMTVDSTYLYTMPIDVFRVSKILIKSDREIQVSDYKFPNLLRNSRSNSISIGGVLYTKVPYVKTRDKLNSSTPATVMFTENPGDSTDIFYRQSYRSPTQILSESIQHDVPSPFDYDFLLPAAAKLIEGQCNGNYDEARRIVRMELKPAMWKELDSGDQGDLDMEPVDRGF
jgi:hypothetical protein